MTYTATITSKRQITLPAQLFSQMGLKTGQKLTIVAKDNEFTMSPAVSAVYKLMGILKRPKEYAGMTEDEMIEAAKNEYFANKKI